MAYRILVAFLVIAALLRAGPAEGQMPPARVVVAEARMIEAPATVTLVGTVGPARRSRVGAEIAGLIVEMPARQGDEIPTGGILCKLNPETLKLRLAEAEGGLGTLRARHEELLAGTRQEELVRLKARLEETEAQFDRWKFEMERIEKLYGDQDSNAKEYFDTRAEFLTAQRRKVAAQADYDLGVNGPRAEVIAQAAYAVAEQQAVVDSMKADLRKTIIRAPFAGYVVERTVEVGEWVSMGGQVVELIELGSVLVRVDAPESALPFLAVGGPARVRVDALKRSFDGRIRHVIPQADMNARTFPVEVDVDNTDRLLASGMFARVTLAGGPAEPAVAVPQDAIVERAGIAYVAAVVPGQTGGLVGMLMPVTVGVDTGELITITSGNVQPGMQVVTRGNENMLPFPTPVQIVDESGSPIATPQPAPQRPEKEGV